MIHKNKNATKRAILTICRKITWASRSLQMFYFKLRTSFNNKKCGIYIKRKIFWIYRLNNWSQLNKFFFERSFKRKKLSKKYKIGIYYNKFPECKRDIPKAEWNEDKYKYNTGHIRLFLKKKHSQSQWLFLKKTFSVSMLIRYLTIHFRLCSWSSCSIYLIYC